VFQPGDELEWNFFSSANKAKPVHTFNFKYDDIKDNTVTLKFTRDISKKFTDGDYTYCIKFLCHDGRLVTLNASNRIVVEECH
jgi:disulfide oxidoreductase YuzD